MYSPEKGKPLRGEDPLSFYQAEYRRQEREFQA